MFIHVKHTILHTFKNISQAIEITKTVDFSYFTYTYITFAFSITHSYVETKAITYFLCFIMALNFQNSLVLSEIM